MHLINKRKNKEKREKKRCTTNTKKYAERRQAVRAGSVRPRGLAVITKSMHLNQSVLPAKPAAGRVSLLPEGADGRSAAYKTKKKG